MSAAELATANRLPSGYDENRIVLMPIDPYMLYAYWEVSAEAKNGFIMEFGQEIWEKSVPVLKITNITKASSFYIRTNEFSDSWYIRVSEPNCMYYGELGRFVSERFFINLAGSNPVVTPGDGISTNKTVYFIDYSDVKSKKTEKQAEKVYESYDLSIKTRYISGISSAQVFPAGLHEAVGISSAGVYGLNP